MRFLLALVVLLAGCPQSKAPAGPLLVSTKSVPNAALSKKLADDVFSYYRFINTEFAGEVCRRFDHILASAPLVNLHGDAHLEQFAVTAHSAGLHDFDDSVSGPAVLDLVRFGTSVRLALDKLGWQASADAAVQRFLSRYREALAETTPPPEVAIVRKLRARFVQSNDEFLAWADRQMLKLSDVDQAKVRAGHERYTTMMIKIDNSRPREFFALKRFGAIRSGIGSSREKRLLARIEGPTPSPSDDVILEAKEVRDLTSVPCVQTQRGDALRVIAGSSSFGRRADPFLAVIPRGADEAATDRPFWIQSWSAEYGELDVDSSLESVNDVLEVIDAVAVQMAIGHISRMRPPYDQQLAALIGGFVDKNRALIRTVIADMAAETMRAHEQFRAASKR